MKQHLENWWVAFIGSLLLGFVAYWLIGTFWLTIVLAGLFFARKHFGLQWILTVGGGFVLGLLLALLLIKWFHIIKWGLLLAVIFVVIYVIRDFRQKNKHDPHRDGTPDN